MEVKIPGRKLAKILIIRTFTSSIIRTLINIVLPIVISLYSVSYNNDESLFPWVIPIIGLLLLILIYNLISEYLIKLEKRELLFIDLMHKCYFDHAVINTNSAIKIYRLGNTIKRHLQSNIPVNKFVFDKIADFNTVAFDICNSIYNIITSKYDLDTECEVTVFKLIGDKVKMVAYSNRTGVPPASYKNYYKICSNNKKYLFVRLFNEVSPQIHYCANITEVKKEFCYIEESCPREEKICQYIGIPLRTDRNKTEVLLQVDVSKPNVFGKTSDEVFKFANNIIYPYITLLHKAFERDAIFEEYYDLIIKHLSSEKKSESV